MDQQRIYLFSRFLKILIIYTLLVILWGAWVRISHSGDGCGDTWPLCQGRLIPEAEQQKTWVEYTHRLMSGLYGLFVLGLYLWGKKVYTTLHPARKAGLFTLLFMCTEALLGAKLVLFKLVGTDSSFFRLFAISLHQINSLLLMGSTLVWMLQSQLPLSSTHGNSFHFKKLSYIWLVILIATTGAWAALASTLFPTSSLAQGWAEDLSAHSHFLLKLRIVHPLLALIAGTCIAVFFWRRYQSASSPELQKKALQNSVFFSVALVFGILTLLMLSPIWMKLAHLAIAHGIFISIVYYAVTSADSTKR